MRDRKARQLVERIGLAIPTLLLLVTTIGCRKQTGTIRDLGTIHRRVGQEISVEGCLEFVCPEFIGAEYPKDCLIELYDDDHDEVLLEFDATTAHFREKLDRHYPVDYPDCVGVQVPATILDSMDDIPHISVAELSVPAPVTTPTAVSITTAATPTGAN
jgi:hypothetical protein